MKGADMAEYRLSGKRTWSTVDPNGDPKAFERGFEAPDDVAAIALFPSFKQYGECWEQIALVRIEVREVVVEVPLPPSR